MRCLTVWIMAFRDVKLGSGVSARKCKTFFKPVFRDLLGYLIGSVLVASSFFARDYLLVGRLMTETLDSVDPYFCHGCQTLSSDHRQPLQ